LKEQHTLLCDGTQGFIENEGVDEGAAGFLQTGLTFSPNLVVSGLPEFYPPETFGVAYGAWGHRVFPFIPSTSIKPWEQGNPR
jgi:hypothetical protein